MARHTKAQIEAMTKQNRINKLNKIVRITSESIAFILGVTLIVFFILIIRQNIAAEKRMLKACEEESQEFNMSEQVCKEIFDCSKHEVGLMTLDEYDRGTLMGERKEYVAKVIVKCTLEAKINEMIDLDYIVDEIIE